MISPAIHQSSSVGVADRGSEDVDIQHIRMLDYSELWYETKLLRSVKILLSVVLRAVLLWSTSTTPHLYY